MGVIDAIADEARIFAQLAKPDLTSRLLVDCLTEEPEPTLFAVRRAPH
jgi:hypothetical protein